MIYELRIYHAMPGKMPALEDRFRSLVVGLLEKHGIDALGFWKTDIGPSNQTITWLVAFVDANDRVHKWNALTTDPEWVNGKKDSEKGGEILSHWENRLLTPTDYSRLG